MTCQLAKQLNPNGEERATAELRRRAVIVAAILMGLLSQSPSTGSPMMSNVPSTVKSANTINVLISSPAPTLSWQSPHSLPTGSPEVVSLQMEAAEDDAFGDEIPSTSALSVVTTDSTTHVAAVEIALSGSRKGTIEATIPIDAKAVTRRQSQNNRRNQRVAIPTKR